MLENVHEAHFFNYNTGHDLNNGHECWCEPQVSWHRNTDGKLYMVVNHADYTHTHHVRMLIRRERDPDYVTKLIEAVFASETPPAPEPEATDDDDEEIIFEADFDLDDFCDDEEKES